MTVVSDYPEFSGELKNSVSGEKEISRTGMFKSTSGIYEDIVFWNANGKMVYLEGKYYSEKNNEYADLFDKMISEINVN